MKKTILKSGLSSLLLLGACNTSEFSTPTVTDTPVEAAPAEELIGQQQQALDTQGFFEARGYYLNNDTVAGDCVAGPEKYTPDVNDIDKDGNKTELVQVPGDQPVVPIQAPNAGGQEVTFSLSMIESSKMLNERLSLDVSASAKFLVGGGDAKFQFAESSSVSETKATLLATVRVRNTAWTVPPGIKLRDDVEPLLTGVAGAVPKLEQIARFRQRCGDGFLHSYTTGGEFFALIQVETSSKAEKESISAHMAGNYLTFSASADFQKSLDKVVSNSKTLVHTYQIGGEGPTSAACADIDCVTKRISEFTTAVTAKPVVFKSEIKPYSILKLPKDGTTLYDIATTRDSMEVINAQRESARDMMSRFTDVIENPATYVLLANTLASIETALNDATENLNLLNDALRACGRNPSTCAVPATKTINTTMPELKKLPPRVVLRPYNKPSNFLVDGGEISSCPDLGTFLRTGGVEGRADFDQVQFDVVNGVNGLPRTLSFQSFTNAKHVTARTASPCSNRVRLTVPKTTGEKDSASFYRERGLNGKPNTWSFRLYGNPGGTPTYLSLSRISAISVVGQPAASSEPDVIDTFKNAVSWYMEEP